MEEYPSQAQACSEAKRAALKVRFLLPAPILSYAGMPNGDGAALILGYSPQIEYCQADSIKVHST